MYLSRGMGDFTTLAPLALIQGGAATLAQRLAQLWAYGGIQAPPASIVAPPGAPQTAEQMTVAGAWTPDQAIAAGAAQTAANISDFFASQPVSVDSADGSGLLWVALMVGGIAALYLMKR